MDPEVAQLVVESQTTHIAEIITATAASLLTGFVFWILRRLRGATAVLLEVKRFMDEYRHNHRVNEADHDLLFKILKVPAHEITEARREAGVSPPHSGL